jgi:hypothetical protein
MTMEKILGEYKGSKNARAIMQINLEGRATSLTAFKELQNLWAKTRG